MSRLKLEHPACPVFYHMIKTHKLVSHEYQSMSPEVYKIRPIVSCVGGPTDRLSWFLTKIIGPLLAKVPSHLANTRQFMELLRNTNFGSQSIVESFDVTSLYTNVHIDAALQAVSQLLDKHLCSINTFGLSAAQILVLVQECLKCNIFRWSGQYCSQIRGLAMRQWFPPVLAVF